MLIKATNRNASFLLDHSQQLINTRLDETLDAATGNFIPDISILGRQVRQRDENYNSSRIFPDIHQYPYATTEGARARLYQQPFITNSPRPPLIPSLIPQVRSREQLQMIAQLQAGATPVPPGLGTGPPAPPPPVPQTQGTGPPINQVLHSHQVCKRQDLRRQFQPASQRPRLLLHHQRPMFHCPIYSPNNQL